MKLTTEEKEQLAEDNFAYIHYFVKKYYSPKWDYDELVGAATIGMTKALNTFDKDKGIKFSTYSARCIINGILMFMRKEKKHLNNISIDQPVYTDKDGSEISILDTLSNPEKELDWREISPTVNKVLDSLTKRNRKIMELFFENKTQHDISSLMGITQSYVSRIIKKVLVKIKNEYWKGENEPMAKLEMTVDEFLKLKYIDKLPITQIAKLKGVADPTIHYWINKHKESIEKKQGTQKQLVTAAKKPCEGKCNHNDKTGEYERLIKELKQQIESSKSDHKERIDWVVKEYEDKLADKQLDNDSIKRDYLLSREENHRLQQTVYDSSYVIENQKNRLGKIAKENEKLEEENKLLKGLIKLWA